MHISTGEEMVEDILKLEYEGMDGRIVDGTVRTERIYVWYSVTTCSRRRWSHTTIKDTENCHDCSG